MGIWNRIFRIGKAETNAALDKIENTTNMVDQGIIELKEKLNKSVEALAQIKALKIQSEREKVTAEGKAKDYQTKAENLAKAIQAGKISEEDGKKAAIDCINSKKIAEADVLRISGDINKHQASVDKMSTSVESLRKSITEWEHEAKTLKARQKVASATADINKQLAGIDANDTLAMMERMKAKVDETEALSESYAEIAGENVSLDKKVDTLLAEANVSGDDDFAALMASVK